MSDSFETVPAETSVKLPVGACRFIATVARCDSENEARTVIDKTSALYNDATHTAYAYKIGTGPAAVCRCNDDGEPSGTAGPPILQAIERAGLTNVVVLGTRYFGGVKLGIGGLIRAYRACAEAGLEAAGRTTEIMRTAISINVSFDMLGQVLREAAAVAGEVTNIEYSGNGPVVSCLVPDGSVVLFTEKVNDATRGNVKVTVGNTNG